MRLASVVLALILGSCAGQQTIPVAETGPMPPSPNHSDAMAVYGPVTTEPHPVPALDPALIDPVLRRQEVDYATTEVPGTIVVDSTHHFLYFVEAGGRARRYGVAVGKEGASWSGTAVVKTKQEWPDWYPTPEMLERRPDIMAMLTPLRGGAGIAGGEDNPIGARGLYLWQGTKDTLYRIHGTTEPYSIGKSVSSGCIRMTNQDIIDLYARTSIGTTVKVLPEAGGMRFKPAS